MRLSAALTTVFIGSAVAFAPSASFARVSALSMAKLNPEETAVVLIEYQNEFTTEGGKLHDAVKGVMETSNMLSNSKAFMDAAREKGCTIIHCPISFDRGHPEISKFPYGILAGVKEGQAFASGEWGSEICEVMKPLETDVIVKGKAGLCGFKSTNLDFVLRQNDIKNVILGGFVSIFLISSLVSCFNPVIYLVNQLLCREYYANCL